MGQILEMVGTGPCPDKIMSLSVFSPQACRVLSPPNSSRNIFEVKLQYSHQEIFHSGGRIMYPLDTRCGYDSTPMFPVFLAWTSEVMLKVEVQARRKLTETSLWKHKVTQLRWNQNSRNSLQSSRGDLVTFILNF